MHGQGDQRLDNVVDGVDLKADRARLSGLAQKRPSKFFQTRIVRLAEPSRPMCTCSRLASTSERSSSAAQILARARWTGFGSGLRLEPGDAGAVDAFGPAGEGETQIRSTQTSSRVATRRALPILSVGSGSSPVRA